MRRRLHREKRHDLEEMVLDHVAQAPGGLVEGAAPFHIERLGERHLHACHLVAVPDGLKERVGEAEIEDVHDRFLGEEVIDAEDRVLRKNGPRDAVELARRGEVAPERLLDDDARVLRQPRGAEAFDDRGKERRWNREVVHGPPGGAERRLQCGERRRIGIVAGYIAQLGQHVA
jgi:hypothetical protein